MNTQRIIALAIAGIMTLCINAEQLTAEGYTFTAISGPGAIIDAISTERMAEARQSGHLRLPDEITCGDVSYTVGSLKTNLFENQDLEGITEITLPRRLSLIEPNVFTNMRDVKVINFGDELNAVSNNNFRNMPDLEELNLPESLYGISWGSLNNLGIRSLTFPTNMRRLYGETMGDPTACNLPNLIELNLGNITVLEGDCLYDLPALQSLNIPSNCEKIGPTCLLNMPSLVRLRYERRNGQTLTLHSDNYGNCPTLKDVYVEDEIPFPIIFNNYGSVPSQYFNPGECTLHVPVGSAEAYAKADYWGKFGSITEDSSGISATITGERGISTHCGGVCVRGYTGADMIVTSPSGKNILRKEVASDEFIVPLPSGIYFVTINGLPHKIAVR